MENKVKEKAYIGFDGRFVLPYNTSVRVLKAKYLQDGLEDMLTDYPVFKNDEFLLEEWDNIVPFNMEDAMQIRNLELRRTVFNFLRLQNVVFADAEVVDVREAESKQLRYDINGTLLEETTIVNRYELVRVHVDKFFPERANDWSREARSNPYVYAVKVVCPTTGNVFYQNVSSPIIDNPFCREGNYHAGEALCSYIMCPITNPKALRRQGDILIWEHSEDSKACTPYAIGFKNYIKLLVAQT